MPTFGRYEILDKLGEGAMGVVYRARDTALGRVVALKMLSAEMRSEDDLFRRFQREAEAVGRLSHPNVVTVYDGGDYEGRLYMAMELLEGEDLRSLIERQVDLPLADRARIMAQICEGLGYAHSRGVIHRDIKPANILVTTSGRVKILDFGLARMAAQSTITRKGVILGTPDYMSPEQAMGRPADPRSDVFSAGSVFYEFLCSEKPFKGKTLHSVLYQIVSEEPDPLLTLYPEMPARLAALVHRMLRKAPEKRPASMEEVGQELQDLHVALRRARARNALPVEDPRGRLRELLARGRAHLDAERLPGAISDMNAALALDPLCDEAAEILWRAHRRQAATRSEAPPPSDPAVERRVEALLARVGPESPEADVRSALAELALIAPDEPRVARVLRERGDR